jgi:hypothetical protein
LVATPQNKKDAQAIETKASHALKLEKTSAIADGDDYLP